MAVRNKIGNTILNDKIKGEVCKNCGVKRFKNIEIY
jgi:hypothetical protein